LAVRYAVLRILVLTDWFPERPGDAAGSFVRAQALAVARRHEVTVLHTRRPPSDTARPSLEAAADGPLRVMRLRSGRFPSLTVANLWATVAALRQMRGRHGLPELLHAHETGAGLAAVAAGRMLGLPVVVSEHSSDFATGDVAGTTARFARLVFAAADLICPVSESLRLTLAEGGWKGRYRVVPNIVDTDLFFPPSSPPRDDPPVILTIATMEPVKGIEELVEGVALLRDRGAEFRAILVGDGSIAQTIAARVDELALGDKLTLTGALRHDELPPYLRRASFLVIPSRWETFSVVLGEAMACGLPVVATAVGALPERVSDATGLLCPPRDPEALAAAMWTMLDRYGMYDRELIAAEVRDRYSPTTVAEEWEAVYAEVLAGHRRRLVGRAR
jgi:glycosyltransferase involved in cell wall biosynthesis